MRTTLLLLLMIAGLIFSAGTLEMVVEQDAAIRTFKPVPALVTGTDLDVQHGKTRSYEPVVHYTYSVNGEIFVSSKVLPFAEHAGYGWAQGIINRYPNGNATAYYDPESPKDSILVREYSLTPYGLLLLAVALIDIPLAFLLGAAGSPRAKMAGVAMGADGWTLLLPQVSLRKGRRNAAIWWWLVTLTVVPPFVHFEIENPHYVGIGLVLIVGVAAMWAGFSIWWCRRWLVARNVSDARVEVNPAPMELGKPLAFRVELDAYRPVRVEKMVGKVVCVEHYMTKNGNKRTYGTRIKGEKSVTMIENVSERVAEAHEVLQGSGEVLFEAGEWPASWDGGVKNYPYFTWEVRVEVMLKGMVDYKGAFPIEVD